MNARRIVSLLPSATEIVCILGASDDLVGISHECDFPAQIRDRPVLTSSTIDPHGSSREIDAAVRQVLTQALSVYSVDYQKLGELAPDLILTQDLCEVCAVSLDDVRAAVARLAHRESIQIVSLRPTRLAHVLADIQQVAEALDRQSAGQRVVGQFQERIDAIRARASQTDRKPRVATLEWLDPIMLGGTWMPELIDLAGGIAVGAQPGEPAPTLSPSELSALDPDVVLIKPCGFDLQRSLQEKELIERHIRPALRSGARLYLTDGNAFFNRPGPRLVESLEIMAACLFPLGFADFAERHREAILRL
jgi:iron complex transport system substrate-binding protein